jgi:predicted MPP superfamily phosphohydrolase
MFCFVPRLLSIAAFLSVLTAVVGVSHYYLYLRLVLPWPDELHATGAAVVFAAAALTPVSLVGGRMLPRTMGRMVGTLGYVWMGASLLLLTGTALSEPLRPLLARWAPTLAADQLLAQGVVAVVALATLAGISSATRTPAVRRVEVTLARLPAAMNGFRLVQLTDLHIGPLLGRSWLEQVVERVNALEPDAIAITGDLVDGPVNRLAEHVAPLADLRARHGVFFVTGNHEYYAGADAWIAELERLGIKVLRNERVALGEGQGPGLDIAGVDDFNAFGPGHGRDLGAALEGRDPARELLLLAHQPRQIDEAAEYGVGLQLSGHTHGGQIFPWNFFVRLQQPYVAGLIQHGDAQLYISRGTGFWGPPMRVGAPAEISLLELAAGHGE